MENRFFEFTEKYTIPVFLAILTIVGLVQPWLSSGFKEAVRSGLGI